MYAVKPCIGGNSSSRAWCSDPVASMSRAFYGMVQLIIVPISDIMST